MNTNAHTSPPETGVARPASPPRFPFTLMFVIWLAVVLVATLVTLILPEQFLGSARIKVERDQTDIRSLGEPPAAPPVYDPHFLQTELEIIRSEIILTNVIETLDLNSVWGRRYYDGQKLKTQESLAFLRNRLDVRLVPRTSLIDIHVCTDQAAEAALCANQIAESYRLWRLDQARQLTKARITALEKELQSLDQRIDIARKELANLPAPVASAPQFDAHKLDSLAKQKELEEITELRGMLRRRIAIEHIDMHLPRNLQVMIIESASLSPIPVHPDKSFNIWLSILIGGISGLLLAILMFLLQRRVYQRKSGAAITTWAGGVRTFLRVTIALGVGLLVGYNCAMPLGGANLFLIQLFVFLGGVAITFVELSKPTPIPSAPGALAERPATVSSQPD